MNQVHVDSFQDASAALRHPDLAQCMYDAGAVVMDQVLLSLHGEAHRVRRLLEFRVFRKNFFAYYEHEVFPPTLEATRELATRIGYVRETIFGGMWDFTANLAFKDTAYTSAAIGPHTDGTYSFDSPGYQMFHCLQFDGSGGESTLVDGFKVAEQIRTSDPAAFEALSTVKVPAQYLGDGVHLRAEHPVIGLDHDGDFVQIAYNNYDRAPFNLPRPRMTTFYRALKLFNELINDPANEITMRLAPGTALLFDNWRTLHGRRAYQGYRRLCGAYLNKEDFESKLRVLRSAANR